MMMGEVLADLCLPYLMSFIVDYGIAGEEIGGSPLAQNLMRFFHPGGFSQTDIIVTFGILMLVITLIGGFFGTFCAWTAAKAAQGFGHDLRRDAYTKVMHLSIEQTDRFTTGSLVTRMTNDVSTCVDLVEMILRMLVRAPVFMIGGIIILLLRAPKFGLVLLVSLPVLVFTLVLVLSRAVPMFSVIQKRLDKVNTVVQENVSGARIVKASVREEYENERFRQANGNLRDVNYKVLKWMAVIMPVLNLVMCFSIIAVIYLGGFSIQSGDAGMSTGTIMSAITYITQVIMSTMMLTGVFSQFSRGIASGKRVLELLDADPALPDGKETAKAQPEAIRFSHVSFQYPGTVGRPVLQDISLSVKKGETLAVIGQTGSGKTSFVSLIPRFYDPSEGTVYVDGLPVSAYRLKDLRAKIGFVMQKSELFSDTIENNIRWGKPDATEEEVRQAAQIAQADSFVQSFSDNYKSFIAEKGASLSGGQKQRMSIARAMVRRPEILILDDATSALDLATEAQLQKAMREQMKGSTVILVAQRIASVKGADRIAVLENDGRIVHCAPHEELLRISPTYRAIYESQMRSGALIESVPVPEGGENHG